MRMADKHSLNYDVRELKLGASFTNNKAPQFHTIKYDFKPASVDVKKMATVEVGTNHQVTVTVPHLDGAGVPQTVFKGNQRPYTKECVLIIDHDTGEITLEKLSTNIQVKKTRQELAQKARPLTPVTTDFTNTTQRSSSRTRVATNRRAPHAGGAATAGAGAAAGCQGVGGAGSQSRYSGGGASSQKTPPNMVRSPQRVKTSPPEAAPWLGGNSTLASLPMIGLDDALGGPQPPASAPPPAAPPTHNGYKYERGPHAADPRPVSAAPPLPAVHITPPPPLVPAVAAPAPAQLEVRRHDSSSSSSSDSDSGSDSGSDSDNDSANAHRTLPNGTAMSHPALPNDVLNDDLCLSESESESD